MVDELLAYGISRDVLVDAEIVLGELMANAVEHGAPLTTVPTGPRAGDLFEVGWCVVGPVLRVSVVDGGSSAALRPGAFDSEALRGRGLKIVDTVCDRWEADLVDGTRVTAQLRLTD
jgi:anti-sigma regulatory factor (Ser/Thr protein kinase)